MMATISKIGSPAESQVHKAPRPEKRAPQADAGQQEVTRTSEVSTEAVKEEAVKLQSPREVQSSPVPEEKVKELTQELQETLDNATADKYEVGFRQDTRTESFVIEIKDEEGELVKQFPPEKVLNLQGKMDELSGIVVDEMT